VSRISKTKKHARAPHTQNRNSPAQVFRLDEDGVEVGIRESQLEFYLLPVHKRGVPPIFRSRLPHDVIPTVRRGHALGSAKELSVEGEGAQPRIGG